MKTVINLSEYACGANFFFPALSLFFLIIYSCAPYEYNPGKNSELTNAEFIPDVHIKSFVTDYYRLKKKLWVLTADDAFFFSRQDIVQLHNISLVQYDSAERQSLLIKSQDGLLFNDSKNVILSNNVVIVSSNDTKVSGSYFIWSNETEMLFSPYMVQVTRPNGDSVRGTGMCADKNLETIRFLSRVRGGVHITNTQ